MIWASSQPTECCMRWITMLELPLSDSKYDDFVDELKEAEQKNECRYGLFDAEYELKDGQRRNKLVFFLW